jgi:PGF-pre-PGF domain-containing protein
MIKIIEKLSSRIKMLKKKQFESRRLLFGKLLMLYLIIFLSMLVNIYALPLPHGIDGIIYELDGITQVRAGIDFSIKDITTGEFIHGKTGYGSSGRYSVSLNGNDGDIIIIKAWNRVNSVNVTVTLQGVMHNVNLYLNMSMPNFPPNITSIPITNATQDKIYLYDVDAFDENDDLLTYSLIKYPTGMIIDSGSGLIVWTPMSNQVGENEVIVQVSDGNLTDFQEFIITVKNINDKPIIISTPITTAIEDMIYSYNVIATDVDNDELIYSLTKAPAGMTINSTTGLINWLPLNEDVGLNNVVVTVSDTILSDTQSFTINVENVNDKPIIISTPIITAIQNQLYIYDVDAIDEDDDKLSYSLIKKPKTMNIDLNTGLINWTPSNSDVGLNDITVEVSDGYLIDKQSFIINVSNVNDAPIITSIPLTNAIEGSIYNYDVNALDIDNDTLMYFLVISPTGMTINSTTGLINWIPTNEQVGLNNVSIGVSDNKTTITQSFTINVENVNDAPIITSTPITNATEDKTYYYDVDAIDKDNDYLIYSLLVYPPGMIIDSTSGLIYWTPTNNHVGNNTVTVQVSDGNLVDIQEFIIKVKNINDAPNITSTPVKSARVNEHYFYDVDATDPDNDSLTYILLVKPKGMKINQETGLIKWKPKYYQIGYNTVVVQVSDGNLTDLQAFNIKVNLRLPKRPPKKSEPDDNNRRGGGGGGGIDIGRRKAFIKEVILPDENLPVMKITIKAENIINDPKIEIEKISERPKALKRMSKKVYQYIKIEKKNFIDNYIENAIINFKVRRKWLEENGIKENDIVLSRFNGTKWEELFTINKSKDDRYIYYEAKTPNFSYFAITIKSGVITKNILKPIISSIKMPHRISGIIYKDYEKKQVPRGTSYVIENLNNSEIIYGKTGIASNSGGYLALIHGNDGDWIRIRIRDTKLNTSFSTVLKGDMDNLDFILNKRKREFTQITGFSPLEIKAKYPLVKLRRNTINFIIVIVLFISFISVVRVILKKKEK